MKAERIVEAKVTRRLSASPERVFDAWLDPAQIRRWMVKSLEGMGLPGEVTRVEVEARVGGRFEFVDVRGGEEAKHWGTYLEIDRPRLLVFTWFTSVEDEQEDCSTVSLALEPDGDGCIATIVHAMDARWLDYRERTEAGWAAMLDASGVAAERAARP